jgi:hypothetical protein
MATLEDTVREVVEELMDNDELFTALDVSNKVKALLPHTRHREVRDVVRAMFTNEIEPKGWARSPITVALEDGTTAEALLYHPLSAAWDLDNKYDQQKRAQVSFNPTKVAAAAVSAASGTATVSTATPLPGAASATITVSASTPVPMPTARDLWKQLFATQPSLFPTK